MNGETSGRPRRCYICGHQTAPFGQGIRDTICFRSTPLWDSRKFRPDSEQKTPILVVPDAKNELFGSNGGLDSTGVWNFDHVQSCSRPRFESSSIYRMRHLTTSTCQQLVRSINQGGISKQPNSVDTPIMFASESQRRGETMGFASPYSPKATLFLVNG